MACSGDFNLGELLKLDDKTTGVKSTQVDRDKTVRLLRNGVGEDQKVFGHLIVDDVNASRKPLSGLRRTSLDDLFVDARSENSYLFLRCTFVLVNSARKVILIAEDHLGGFVVCLICNHVFVSKTDEEEFPRGVVLIVKEPFIKQSRNEYQVLVVFNPSDLVKVTRNHDLWEQAVQLDWIDTKNDPITAQGWKNAGIKAFRLGKSDVAIEAYLMALKFDPKFEMLWNLHLNLVLTYYKAGFYELCLEHSSKVLEMQPKNQKSLYHAGLSHYQLRQYESAKQCFNKLLQINPSHQNAVLESQRCSERIKEQRGDIDIFKLFDMRSTDPFQTLELGDFVGPVEITSLGDKGRGTIAKEDIKPGTLVIAEKALVAEMIQNSRETFGQRYAEYSGMLEKTLSAIHRNPKTFGKLLNLHCNSSSRENGGLFCDETDQSEQCLDVPRILGIVTTNTFLLRSRMSGGKHSLLYYHASFVNHSCVPNCSMFTYNDVMLIRTITLVKKGEELAIAYKVDLGPRLEELSVRGFTCNCAYCDLERRDSFELKMQRLALLRLAPLTQMFFRNEADLRRIVSSLEETYRGRESYTTALFRPYLELAECLNVSRGDFESRFMHFADKALKCLGLSTRQLLRCAEDENSHLPRDALLADEDMLYEVAMKIMLFEPRRSQRRRWFKVLLMLERTYTGGDYRMLVRRFPEAALALPLAFL